MCSSFSAGSSNTRSQTSFQVRTFPVHRAAVQHSTIHSGAPTEDALQGPVRSSALDYRPEHHSQGSALAFRHVGVHGFAGTTEKTSSLSGPVVGRHSMVPEDRELVRSDPSSSVGFVRGGLVGISSSPARSTPRRQGDGSDCLHGCVQFGLGSPVRLTLNTGTVSISTIVAHQRSGDAGRHQRSERLPASSEVPGGSLDVRQRSDCGLHQERGGHEIAHCDAADHTTAEVVQPQGDYVGSRPSARSAQHPGGFPVQSRPDTDHGVDDGHGASTTHVCQVGRAAGGPLRHSPTDDSSSSYPHIRTPGQSGQMSMPWDNGRGLLYAFPPFKMVPQVLQKIAQPPRIRMILITQLQPAASWFPELMYLSQEDPIPLYIEGQDLLTQDVWTGDGVTETPHFRPSNLHTWKLYGPSWVRRVIPGKLLTWCQGAFWNFHSKCTNPIGQDSWRSVGRNDGTCFESEVIITAPTWCTSSETDFSHQR